MTNTSTRKIAKLVYQLQRVVDTYSDVAMQLEHDADTTRNKVKRRALIQAAMNAWAFASQAQDLLETAPQRVLRPIMKQAEGQQYDRYLGGQWLRERAPRVFRRHSRFFTLAYAA